MIDNDFENWETKDLLRRKRFIDIVMGIMVGFLLITTVAVVWALMEEGGTPVFVGFFIIVPFFPMIRNRKKIIEELRKRG